MLFANKVKGASAAAIIAHSFAKIQKTNIQKKRKQVFLPVFSSFILLIAIYGFFFSFLLRVTRSKQQHC